MSLSSRVFLVGFMGSGKSTIGRRLAVALGYSFLDLDHYIESLYHYSIPQLFEKFGEPAFRKLERSALEKLTDKNKIVVATGGGTPCFGNNMERMKSLGWVLYLQVPLEILLRRLEKSRADRPLIRGLEGDDLRVRIANLMGEREKWYQQASLCFRIGEEDPAFLTERIVELLEPIAE